MKSYIKSLIITLCLFATSCSAFRYGYTSAESFNRYLVIDAKGENFGYERLKTIMDYRSGVDGFVNAHGQPEMIYEFKNSEGREGLRLFYIAKGNVYEFIEANWKPDSIFLKEQRQITEEDKVIYQRALKD